MGKKDVISKIYLGAADRIADLLNNELFEGGSAVAASDIMELGQHGGEHTERGRQYR